MKYCVHCGSEIHEEAVICVKCGRAVETNQPAVKPSTSDDNAMAIVIKVFLIIGCITQGWLLIPLAWCLPITISVFNSLRDKKPVSTGIKICALIFVNLIAGICLLCAGDEL